MLSKEGAVGGWQQRHGLLPLEAKNCAVWTALRDQAPLDAEGAWSTAAITSVLPRGWIPLP